MSIEELREHYRRVWNESSGHGERMAFIEALVEHHDREHLEFHFSLLEDRTHFYFYCSIRSALTDHGLAAEALLVEKFRTETRPLLRGDALQLLGHLQSSYAREFALAVVESDHEDLRYRGVIVLGWLGTPRDMTTVLRDRLFQDSSAFVRGNAATAFRQVWYRHQDVDEDAVPLLGEALAKEEDEEAVYCIVAVLQTIMSRRFGVRELDGEDEDFAGDPWAAKARALTVLEDQLSGEWVASERDGRRSEGD